MEEVKKHHSGPCLSAEDMRAYLAGEVNETEQQRIEQAMAECEICFGAMEALDLSITDEYPSKSEFEGVESHLIAEIRALHQTTEKPRSKVRSLRTVLKYAAVVLLFVVPSWFLIDQYNSEEQLFARYFTPYEDILNIRASEQLIEEQLQEAMRHYNDADYPKAIALYESVLTTAPDYHLVHLYCGISKLASEQADQAIPHFKTIITDGSTIYEAHANWYLALSYLKLKNTTEAAIYLTKLTEDENKYRKQASTLLEKLP